MDFYISKTDFKLGSSCARKLWYKKNGYPTTNDENEYLQYLAKGGYIIGKMAHLIYRDGVDLSHISDWDEAVEKTKCLIEKNENIIIYEATVFANKKLVRIDILEKKGKQLNIIEVKAKSQASQEEKEKIPQDYLHDVVFQVITVEEAYPEFEIKGYLFLPDKSKINEIEGLAGWFIVEDESNEINELEELPARNSRFYLPKVTFKFEKDPNKEYYLEQLRQHSILELRDIKKLDFNGDWSPAKRTVKTLFENLYKSVLDGVPGALSKNCKSCEFASDENGKNGFKQCWKDFEGKELSAFELYYGGAVLHGKGNFYLNQLIESRKMSLNDIDIEVLTKGKSEDSYSSRVIRQLMQLESSKERMEKVRTAVLRQELNNWVFPLYFIDFETYTGAIPFHRNMRPYELIAFQWSCHKLNSDGTLQHFEWINLEESFPNFRFAESLMEVVGNHGTPLMWSHHENTVLRRILEQMEFQGHKNDKLSDWLKSMTHDKSREGRLVDMAKVCEITYVHPDCKGKVSIKKILPVIWNNELNNDIHSDVLFKEYYKVDDNGKIMDPYKTLTAVMDFMETSELEAEEVVAEGTAAMKAYFELMYGRGKNNTTKKFEIRQLLLQYCKLDTIAMVIIYKYWEKLINS